MTDRSFERFALRVWMPIAAVVTLIVLVVALGGTSRGTAPGATATQTIVLLNGEILAEAGYPLRDTEGDRSGSMSLHKGVLFDEDRDEVGRHRCDCTLARGVGWMCTHILSLRPGPFTERGSIVVAGLFKGFSGERLAITGGTGAYAGARGYATSTVNGDDFVTRLYLTW